MSKPKTRYFINRQKESEKRVKRAKRVKHHAAVLRFMQQQNKVKYERYPLTFEEAEAFMITGLAPDRKGVNQTMVTITLTDGTVSKVVDETGADVEFTVEVTNSLSTPAPEDTTSTESTTPANDGGAVEEDTAAVEADEAKLDADTATLDAEETTEEAAEANPAPADATADAGSTEPQA